MSRSTNIATGVLKRLARYLRARPRMVFDFEFQTAEGIECYTDTEWEIHIWRLPHARAAID